MGRHMNWVNQLTFFLDSEKSELHVATHHFKRFNGNENAMRICRSRIIVQNQFHSISYKPLAIFCSTIYELNAHKQTTTSHRPCDSKRWVDGLWNVYVLKLESTTETHSLSLSLRSFSLAIALIYVQSAVQISRKMLCAVQPPEDFHSKTVSCCGLGTHSMHMDDISDSLSITDTTMDDINFHAGKLHLSPHSRWTNYSIFCSVSALICAWHTLCPN